MPSVALLHVHQVSQQSLAKALDQVLVEWKYQRKLILNVPADGPAKLERPLDPGPSHVCYLIGPRNGNWTTLIQAFEERDDAPFLADLSNRLSQQLQTHSLAILLLDGDILFYNLDYRGTPRDGYSSNPQFFADERLSDQDALRHRHMPKAFTPLLPKTIQMERLMELLNVGWWKAYDTGQLDETGDPLYEDALVDEEERLAQLGAMLQLNGLGGYPFSRWRSTTLIDWKVWKAVYYQAKARTLPIA
ncbi:MAG TPA: hypothetical protein PKA06_06990 [Gemmatales bacterium]|nr:hypothetical protein [Gemmatales bacterium]